jgi:hypothetical protein
MRNIMELVRLIRILENEDYSKDEKVKQIKQVRKNGDITEEEAIELAVEYL